VSGSALTAPQYGRDTLADLMPAVLGSLGVELPVRSRSAQGPAAGGLPGFAATDRACVLLVDGLGDLLLRERAGHAPFLRSQLERIGTLDAGFPTTTATSMGSFGTGLPPGSHGLVGYEVLVPERDELLNELSWEPAVDPRRWQRETTVFQHAAAAGVEVVRIGPGFFDGSGLTEAALRGGRFVAADSLDDRVDAAIAVLRSAARCLVYVYWGDVDKVGHVNGCGSWEWGEELARVDLAVRRLAAGLPRGATLHLTADHGMVDVPHHQRIDLAHDPELARGVRHCGGEPRCPQLYCEPGQAESVLVTWSARLGERADVLSRDDAITLGLFGAVAPHVRDRIGDVVVACRPGLAVVDSARMRPALLSLVGLHGSLTPQESLVPLLTLDGPT
jgi:hypothetical protein